MMGGKKGGNAMKSKKIRPVLGALCFCLLALALYGVWRASRPQTADGAKRVTVEVTHSDGTQREFSYTAGNEEESLEDLLVREGLISGSEGPYGLFVDTVDGETADYDKDGAWWRLTCGGEDAQTGAAGVVLEDGGTYGWIYSAG